jgi:chloramphenicol-sensitive protein RarD
MEPNTTHDEDRNRLIAGLACGLGAHILWGIVGVLYFKQVAHVPPIEVIAHRIIWSLLVMLIITGLRGQFRPMLALLGHRKRVGLLFLAALLVAVNWLVFIYAVSTKQVTQSSLGYFMNPLVNVLLGVLILRERMNRAQLASVALACFAVIMLVVAGGVFPWISLTLAISFGFYALLRKLMPVDSALALTIECLLMLPIGLFIIAWGFLSGRSALDHAISFADWITPTLLFISGIITATPLLLFGLAAKRLSMVLIGFVQYIGPTCQLLLAVLVFRERIDPVKWWAFAMIWTAVLVFSVDLIRRARSKPKAVTTKA